MKICVFVVSIIGCLICLNSKLSYATETSFELNNQVVFVYDINGELVQVNKVSEF